MLSAALLSVKKESNASLNTDYSIAEILDMFEQCLSDMLSYETDTRVTSVWLLYLLYFKVACFANARKQWSQIEWSTMVSQVKLFTRMIACCI